MTDALRDFYARYIDRCNLHRFAELAEFVADPVEVNGEPTTVQRYGVGLADVVELVPDFHWEIRQLLVDGDRLGALLVDTGTLRTGRSVRFHELAQYRVTDCRIVEVWGDLDGSRLVE